MEAFQRAVDGPSRDLRTPRIPGDVVVVPADVPLPAIG